MEGPGEEEPAHQPGAGRGWLRWPGLGPQCPAGAWVGVVRGTGSGARMPELCGTERAAGLSVPHILPCEWGDNARQDFVGVQGDVRAQDPPPFCLVNRWPGPMLLCGGGARTCRRRADTPAAPRPRRAPAPSSTRGTRWARCSAPGSSGPAGCAAGSSPPAAAASAGHMGWGHGRSGAQGWVRPGRGQDKGPGQIPERGQGWESQDSQVGVAVAGQWA